jgi:hypothetical protein
MTIPGAPASCRLRASKAIRSSDLVRFRERRHPASFELRKRSARLIWFDPGSAGILPASSFESDPLV